MPSLRAEPVYALSLGLVGLLALWLPGPAVLASGLVLGAGVQFLRRRQDKSAAALKARRRPLVEALWDPAASTAGPRDLAGAVSSVLEQAALSSGGALLEFDAAGDRLRGHRLEAPALDPVSLAVDGRSGLATGALRSGRPRTARAGSPGVLAVEEELGVAEGSWVALPLLDPAPPAACLDQGFLHRTGCPARQGSTPVDAQSWRGDCAGCALDPVRGVLAIRLSEEVEEVGLAEFLESIARTLGTILSLRQLGHRLEAMESGREQLLDAMLNGLIGTDAEGRIRYVNRRAREMFAGTGWLGRRLDEFVRLPAGSSALTRALLEGRATLRAEGLLQREDADAEPANLPVRVNLTPLHNGEGAIEGTVCVLEDRSDVLELENEVRHLDTLAALGRFASGLAHEVRNPLGGIQAGVEYLEQCGEFSAEIREHLSVIQGEVLRVDSILADLLQVARPRELVATPVDPNALARSVLDGFTQLAGTVGVRLELDAVPSDERIHVDEQMIRQVLVNLVKNAIEASPPGGTVTLLVIPADPADASRARAGFVVSDRGPGIPAEDRPRLFEPFFTRKSHGTGLGLYVSHGFVERHGGRLRVTDRPGGGSSFRVDLPRVAALVGG